LRKRYGRHHRQLEIPHSDIDKSYGSLRRLTSSNDDIQLEVISFRHSITELEVLTTFGVFDIVSRQLFLPLLLPVAVAVAAILRGDNDTSFFGSDDVTPTLVVVDSQGDDEVLACVGYETKRAERPAAAHGEHVRSANP